MNLFFKSSVVFSIFVCSSLSWGHARLLSPAPRNNNSGIKSGPCGGLARSTTPTVLQGGQSLVLSWEETVNHPGKFLFALSMDNDNFSQNLASVTDNQNGGGLPHAFSTIVQIPNINCETCTIQMIQSMEENPSAPTYYYSCADVRIVASTGGGAPVGGQGVSEATPEGPKMSGCGLVKEDLPPPSMKHVGAIVALFLMPITVALTYRRKLVRRRI